LPFLDLRDDPAAIAQYEAHHRAAWPEMRAHLREQGVTGMQMDAGRDDLRLAAPLTRR
jgi:L-rhamnose mutarotase